MKNKTPKIFISHSWEDRVISRKLAGCLDNEGAEIWIYYSLIAKGNDLPNDIVNKIQCECNFFILIWSSSAKQSHNVALELRCAFDANFMWRHLPGNNVMIIICMIDNEELPTILKEFYRIDFKNFENGYSNLVYNFLKSSLFEKEPGFCGPQGSSPSLEMKRKPKVSKTDWDWSSEIEKQIGLLSFGQVIFNIAKLMKIGKKVRIEVRISKDLENDITKKLKKNGTPEIEISRVGNFMKVRLSGDNFKIDALNEEEQIVAKDTYTEWAWDVVPLKSKTQVLHFHVTIRLKIKGSEEKRDYPVIDKEVYVKVSPVYSTKVFVANNWKMILTALVIPFLL